MALNIVTIVHILLQEITVKELHEAVEEKTGLKPEEQQLIFSGKQLENDKNLVDYPQLRSLSTIYLVARLPGGGSNKSKLSTNPEAISTYKKPCSLCLIPPSHKMPCSHFYCQSCVKLHSWNEVNENKRTEIKCFTCKSEWDLMLSVIQRYGSVSKNEMDALANKLSENYIYGTEEIRECPGCGYFCRPQDNTKTRVYCKQCAKENRNAEYCFYCSESWKNPLSKTNCGNPNCNPDAVLDYIRKAPKKKMVGVECPSVRLCPNCGGRIEHKGGCKHMTCIFCESCFCFICLKTQLNGSWQCGSYDSKCSPAPIQTVIPKK